MSFWPPAVASDEGPTPASEAITTGAGGVTVTVTSVECDNEPLVPVTVTV